MKISATIIATIIYSLARPGVAHANTVLAPNQMQSPDMQVSEEQSEKLIIAAGQGMRVPSPIPVQPITPVAPDISSPSQAPSSAPQDLYGTGTSEGQQSGNAPAPNTGTIEYDEALS